MAAKKQVGKFHICRPAFWRPSYLPWFAPILSAAAGSSIVAAAAVSSAAACGATAAETDALAGWREAEVARAAQGYELRAQLV